MNDHTQIMVGVLSHFHCTLLGVYIQDFIYLIGHFGKKCHLFSRGFGKECHTFGESFA